MHFSSCPGYLCLKIECNHVKKVMWDIEEKEPDVTFSDFHLWVVLSEPREHSNPIKAVSIIFHHLTADRRTGGLQFTSLCGLSWFGFFFLSEFQLSKFYKIHTLRFSGFSWNHNKDCGWQNFHSRWTSKNECKNLGKQRKRQRRQVWLQSPALALQAPIHHLADRNISYCFFISYAKTHMTTLCLNPTP